MQDSDHGNADLVEKGYTVIDNVLSPSQRRKYLGTLKQFLSDAHGGWDHVKTFSGKYNSSGIWDGVQHHPLL